MFRDVCCLRCPRKNNSSQVFWKEGELGPSSLRTWLHFFNNIILGSCKVFRRLHNGWICLFIISPRLFIFTSSKFQHYNHCVIFCPLCATFFAIKVHLKSFSLVFIHFYNHYSIIFIHCVILFFNFPFVIQLFIHCAIVLSYDIDQKIIFLLSWMKATWGKTMIIKKIEPIIFISLIQDMLIVKKNTYHNLGNITTNHGWSRWPTWLRWKSNLTKGMGSYWTTLILMNHIDHCDVFDYSHWFMWFLNYLVKWVT